MDPTELLPLRDYGDACWRLAKPIPPGRVLAKIASSCPANSSTSRSLGDLLSVVSADEGAIEAKWHERCGGSAYFAAAGLVLVQTFGELGALAGCGELLWAGHFLALLSLGGHTLDELKFSIDGGVELQGARALPDARDGSCVRPDQCIGPPGRSVLPSWNLRAGKAILPLDLVEFKKDTGDHNADRLCYAAIVCAYHQLDLHDAAMTESRQTTTFSAAIPFTLATSLRGGHFEMTVVWHAEGEGLCLGTLYGRRITSVIELKRCFLLRHEAINLAIRFGDMAAGFSSERGPRQDAWWRKLCLCGEKDGRGRDLQCAACLNWFHPRCVGELDHKDPLPRRSVPWFCPDHQPGTTTQLVAESPSIM